MKAHNVLMPVKTLSVIHLNHSILFGFVVREMVAIREKVALRECLSFFLPLLLAYRDRGVFLQNFIPVHKLFFLLNLIYLMY